MSPIKTTKQAVYDLKYHFVWAPKDRKKLLTGDVVPFVKQVFSRMAIE
jgi:putative transposase